MNPSLQNLCILCTQNNKISFNNIRNSAGLDIYSACAGINYNGPAIDCMYGLKCFAKDAYYSQCLFTCPSGWECTVTSHSTVPSTNITTVSHNTCKLRHSLNE